MYIYIYRFRVVTECTYPHNYRPAGTEMSHTVRPFTARRTGRSRPLRSRGAGQFYSYGGAVSLFSSTGSLSVSSSVFRCAWTTQGPIIEATASSSHFKMTSRWAMSNPDLVPSPHLGSAFVMLCPPMWTPRAPLLSPPMLTRSRLFTLTTYTSHMQTHRQRGGDCSRLQGGRWPVRAAQGAGKRKSPSTPAPPRIRLSRRSSTYQRLVGPPRLVDQGLIDPGARRPPRLVGRIAVLPQALEVAPVMVPHLLVQEFALLPLQLLLVLVDESLGEVVPLCDVVGATERGRHRGGR